MMVRKKLSVSAGAIHPGCRFEASLDSLVERQYTSLEKAHGLPFRLGFRGHNSITEWDCCTRFSNGCAFRPARVKTLEGREQVLELIEYIAGRQKMMPKAPAMFAPDYRKVKKMLGLE
jgi:hypothetical protein